MGGAEKAPAIILRETPVWSKKKYDTWYKSTLMIKAYPSKSSYNYKD